MPLQRRLPKRGFTNVLRKRWAIVNVSDLARLTEDRIDPGVLAAHGLVKGAYDGIKVLGDGELTRPLQVQAHAISAGARQKIEGAGGSFEVISR
jgi:large subunit ribosomal protein L15